MKRLKNPVILRYWRLETDKNGLTYLGGVVSNHPIFQDGDNVTTSNVIGKAGDCVITQSGVAYRLGNHHLRSDPGYAALFATGLQEVDLSKIPYRYENVIRQDKTVELTEEQIQNLLYPNQPFPPVPRQVFNQHLQRSM